MSSLRVISRRTFSKLVAVAAVLLVASAVLSPLAMLLEGLADAQGALWIRRASVACLVVLAIDLICLLLAVGVNASEPPDEEGDSAE